MNNPETFVDFTGQALRVLMLASAPILIPTLLAGLILGMVQAATSINEATLSFVPKMAILILCLALFGSTIGGLIADFTLEIFAAIPDVTR